MRRPKRDIGDDLTGYLVSNWGDDIDDRNIRTSFIFNSYSNYRMALYGNLESKKAWQFPTQRLNI